MNTIAKTRTLAQTNIATIAAVFLMGLSMVYVAGFAQSATLHESAHDVRHANGFPCH